VLLRNVGFGLSGNFSCEVTADAPLFSTATAVDTMQVVGKSGSKLIQPNWPKVRLKAFKGAAGGRASVSAISASL